VSARYRIRAGLGPLDLAVAEPASGVRAVSVDLLRGSVLRFGIGKVIRDASRLGLTATEMGIDLLILAALIHAADTRIPRQSTSQDSWTREIALSIPVSDPDGWRAAEALLRRMLDFLSGDRWDFEFRPRPPRYSTLATPPIAKLPGFTSVCLFSGGLDSLVGAIDLLAAGGRPLLVSHAAEGSTSQPQNTLEAMLRAHYPAAGLARLRAWISFRANLLHPEGSREDSTRARSFLFFAIAAFAGAGLGRPFTLFGARKWSHRA
jgi:hypothetical protein